MSKSTSLQGTTPLCTRPGIHADDLESILDYFEHVMDYQEFRRQLHYVLEGFETCYVHVDKEKVEMVLSPDEYLDSMNFMRGFLRDEHDYIYSEE